jgi:hypothetical protein
MIYLFKSLLRNSKGEFLAQQGKFLLGLWNILGQNNELMQLLLYPFE